MSERTWQSAVEVLWRTQKWPSGKGRSAYHVQQQQHGGAACVVRVGTQCTIWDAKHVRASRQHVLHGASIHSLSYPTQQSRGPGVTHLFGLRPGDAAV